VTGEVVALVTFVLVEFGLEVELVVDTELELVTGIEIELVVDVVVFDDFDRATIPTPIAAIIMITMTTMAIVDMASFWRFMICSFN
jgi:hypothetical protein